MDKKDTLGLDSLNTSSGLKEIPWDNTSGALTEIPWDTPAKQPGAPDTRQRLRQVDAATLRLLADQEGAGHLVPVIEALYGQESGSGANARTSTDGAQGGMQIIPATFQRYAKPGERIDSPDDNMRVGVRIIKDLANKFGNDPAKIATGYFSGEGNVNPGQGSAWKNDARDGNGKSVSGYVSDVLKRVGGAPTKEQAPQQSAPDLDKAPKWKDVIGKPEYAALSDAEKAEAKAAYFDYWIAPHAGDERDAIRAKFLSQKDEGPSLLSRAASAVGDMFKSEPSIAEKAAALPAKELPTTSRVPVERKVRDAFNAQWDAATPEQRAALAQQPGWQGMLARERAGLFEQAGKAAQGTPSSAMLDPRVEARRAQLIAKGEDPRFAERAAMEGARAGALPGQEVAALGGTAQKSEFDFDTKNLFDPNKNPNGLNNPLTRGIAKGGLGLGKAAAGYTQFVGDVLGIDGMAKSGKRVGGAISGKEDAIGDRGDFLGRNFEGAINSITQQLPLLIGGVKGASEAAVLSGMAFQSFGQEYSDGRAKGQDVAQATTRAAIFAAFEVIGEKFGLGDQLAALKGAAKGMPTDQILGFLGSALKKEIPGELLTTTGQFATDKFAPGGVGLTPQATGADYLKQVADTIAQTFMQSGLMAGGTTGVSKAVQFAREGRDSSAVMANAARESALSKWSQGLGGTPTSANVTPDGRLDPTTAGTSTMTPAEPSPIDVHPTVQTADAIVKELAAQAGIPESTVLPTPAANSAEAVADQDVMDFASVRYDQLRAKRDGSMETVVTEQGPVDQTVPGVGLSAAEAQELAALEKAQGNPQALRALYGFDKPQGTPLQETQNAKTNQQGQAVGPAPSPSAVSTDGQPSGAATVESAAGQAPSAQSSAGAGQRYPGVSAQAPVVSLADRSEEELRQQLRNANSSKVRKAISEELARRKAVEATKTNSRVKPDEPPLAEGMTRLYHGNATPGRYDGKAWFSTQRSYAENYRGSDSELQYVDVPTERINKLADPDGYGQTPDKGFQFNVEFDSADVGVRKPLLQTKPAAPTAEKEAKEQKANGPQAVEAQQAEAQGSEAPAVSTGAVDPAGKTDKKRQAALDRIANGTAYFYTPDKAKDFIKKNGLADTHEAVKNGKRFEIVAKGAEAVGEKPKTEKEAREQREAPGTRINGDVERKAADRLEQLYNQMGNITNRNSLEGNAKAAVQGVIAELRKEKTVSSVTAILNDAADALDRNYRAFADVIREVSDDLGGETAKDSSKAEAVKPKTDQAPKADDFDAMFDDVLAEELAKDEGKTAKPKNERETKYNRLSDEWNALTEKRKAAPESERAAIEERMRAIDLQMRAIQGDVQREAMAEGNAKRKQEAKAKYGAMPIGTRIGLIEFPDNDNIYLEKTGTDEWTRFGIGSDTPTRTSAEMEGDRVIADAGKEARAQRTAAESLASAAKNTAAGLDAAIDGLGKLFGGSGRLSSGLTFDEETYAKAKPLFLQAIANLKDAGSDLKEAMRTVVRMVLDKFGAEAAGNMKPYVVRFIEETAGTEKRAENATTATDLFTPEGKFKVAKEIADFLIGDGSFKTIIEARKQISEIIGRPIEAATELAKQADEAIETGVVLAGREIVEAGRKQGRSPEVIYSRLVDLYNRQPNLSVRSSTSVRDQAYSTPVPLAYLASELAGITYNSKVLEPTAGNGMLLVGAKLENSVANELNPKRAAMLDAMGFKAEQKNAATESMAPAKSQDAVIANPPFGVTKDAQGNTIIYEVKPNYGTREVDHAIAFKALDTMKDDGRAVLIVGGVQSEAEEARREDYRGKSKRTFYFNLYNDYNVVDHFTVDGDLYSKQGASYPVDVIVIDGRGKSARDLPAADLPKIIRSYDELKEKLNGANGVESRADSGTDGVGGRDGQTGSADGEGLGGSTGGSSDEAGTQSQPNGSGSGVRVNGPANGGRPESGGQRVGNGQLESQNAPQPGAGGKQPVSGNGEQQQPGRAGSNRANRSDSVGGSSVVAGERVESGLTDRRGEEQETETQVAYAPHSQASSVGTLVPKAMRDAIDASIQRIEDRVGDLDQYVADSLKMDAETLRANFSAEQVDALALAIDNAESGAGFIIGDQTGIGKGRVVAAMIRYALVNGKTPIFVTEKPNLYSDMIRDLDDIGMTDELALDTKKPRILITNGGESIPYTLIRNKNGEVTETNLTLKSPKSGKALDEMMRDMAASDSLGEYRVIFTTYSQLQTVKSKVTERQRFVKQFGDSNYMIFDESHNAGGGGEQQARSKDQRDAEKKGESTAAGRSGFVRDLVKNAYGTFFSSATYAKRPDVMDLYSSTNMSLAVDRPRDLADAIKRGGVPMQQVVATMLTKDGQYIRRERTFAGVSYDTVETRVDKETAENMASAMRSILAFSRAKEAVIADMQKEMDKQGAMLSAVGGESSSVQGANFGSIMHNLIDQMLLSLKAQDSVNHAIERLKAGEKVVMTVSNTMGSFLKNYAEDMNLNAGDPVALSFSDLYNRYLEKQRIVKIKSANGEVKEHRLTDAELGPSLVAMFQRIKQQIAESGFGSAPISPIDYMHAELRKAGYKTDEITGRTIALNYESGEPVLATRTANIKQRVGAVRGFNNGDTDVLILNQAGSTGLSLHASSKFKDQRKRHMIVVQAEKNIDTHMQMLGRVHRTGQVVAPAYSQMMADIPAEMRPAAVLLKKMASLNANTTASRKSAVTAEGVVDFMNDYGGQVVHEYLRDNPEVYQAIGGSKVIKLVEDPTEDASEDDIRKLTGYIPILPIAQQETIYKDLIDRYNELLERENSLGTNKLEAKALDLDAETIDSQPITEQKESPSIFAAPAQMERVDVKRTVKPYSTAEITDMVKERRGDKTAVQIANEAVARLVERTADYSKKTIEKMQAAEAPDPVRIEATRNQIDMALNIAKTVLSTYRIGDTISITDNNGQVLYGAITDISNSGRTANPAAGSDWKMQIALANGDAKSLTLSFSQLAARYRLAKETSVNWYNAETQALEPMRVLDIFDKGATVRREKRWMVTGNILAGFAQYQGQIVSYTKKDGTIGQGVLMSRQFDFAKEQKNAPVRIKSADAASKFFGATADGATIGTPDAALRIIARGNGYTVLVPSSKKEGGTYFLDSGLTNALGGDFYKTGSVMTARNVTEAQMRNTVEYLLKQREETLVALSNQEQAREMFAVKGEAGPREFNDIASPLPATIKVDGKDRPTRNSQGKNIHPTAEGVRNFWKWFGDSKVVDEQGRPLVVYHGTNRDFNAFERQPWFRKQEGLDSIGSWFTDNPDRAADYGDSIMPVYLKIETPNIYDKFVDLRLDWSEAQPARGDYAAMHKQNKHWGSTEAYRDSVAGTDGVVIKQHGDAEWKNQTAYVAFDPTQIKSAIGNTGAFDGAAPSILNDLSTAPAAAFTRTPEPVRANALTKLKGLERRLSDGSITESEYRLGVQQLIGKLEQRNDARDERRMESGRRRGADWIVAQLRRGVADNTVPRNEADFAEWLLDQNPNLANGLGISISGKDGNGAAGNYNPLAQIAKLFTSANLGSGTAVHEILHHTERMMPVEVQNGVMKAWQRAWDAAYKAGDAKLKAALDDMLAASLGDKNAHGRTKSAFAAGTLRYADHYQLFSPSEFWTVNATNILSGRFAAQGSWVKTAIQWFKEFVQRAKAVFGLRSDAPILEALDDVMKGEGVFQPGAEMMAERVDGASKSGDILYNDIVRKSQERLDEIGFFGNAMHTQKRKGELMPEYGKVWKLARQMQATLARAANRPADMAPGVLAKVDDVGAAAKSLVWINNNHKHKVAAAAALFAGTTAGETALQGRVWTEDEFKQRFSSNEAAWKMYQQSRNAINQSLTEVASAEAYSVVYGLLGKDRKTILESLIDSPQYAESVISEKLNRLISKINAAIEKASEAGNDQQVASLEETRATVEKAQTTLDALFQRAQDLKNAGYAPLMRFGPYMVTVRATDPATGEKILNADGKPITLERHHFETEGEAMFAKGMIEAKYSGRDDVVIASAKQTDEKNQLYSGVSPETIAIFGDVLGQKKVAEKFIQNILNERNAMKRRLDREQIEGFSQDLPRVLASFITSNARFAAQKYHMREIRETAHYMKQGDSQTEAKKLITDVLQKIDEDPGAVVSSAAFSWFIGGNVGSAITQVTQPVLQTYGELVFKGGKKAATIHFLAALPYAAGLKQITDPDLRKALKRASEFGVVESQEIYHLYSTGARNIASWMASKLAALPGAKNTLQHAGSSAQIRLQAFGTLWGSMFAAGESLNRRISFIAAYTMAKEMGKTDPFSEAVDVVDNTQGIFDKINRPNFARKGGGRTLLIFQQFKITYLEQLGRYMKKGGPEGRRALLIMAAIMMLAAGEEGLPFALNIEDLIGGIARFAGYNLNTAKYKREKVEELLNAALSIGFEKETAEKYARHGRNVFLYGLSSLTPFDMSRLGLGRILPTQWMTARTPGEMGRAVVEIIGPVGSMGQQVQDAFDKGADDGFLSGLSQLAPTAVVNAKKGVEMWNTGEYRNAKGAKIGNVNGFEAVGKGLGLQPSAIALKNRAVRAGLQDVTVQKDMQSMFLNQYVRAERDNDTEEMKRISEKVDEWNAKNPEAEVRLTAKNIIPARKNLSMDLETRSLKSAPKRMRGDLADTIGKQ
jgi:hypothetical protein